jgi:hypothetical protein
MNGSDANYTLAVRCVQGLIGRRALDVLDDEDLDPAASEFHSLDRAVPEASEDIGALVVGNRGPPVSGR